MTVVDTWQDVIEKCIEKTECLFFIFSHQQQQPGYEVQSLYHSRNRYTHYSRYVLFYIFFSKSKKCLLCCYFKVT